MFESGRGGSAAAPRPAPSRAVARLQEALDALRDVDPVELPEAQALEDARQLLAAHEQLQALLLRRLGDVDTRALHRMDASPTTSAWLRAQGSSVDSSTVALARRLSRLPALEQAVRCRALDLRSAGLVSTALTRLRPLVDRVDGLVDGQPGEAAVTAVVVDGVRSTVCQALGGVADADPRVAELDAQLSEISCWPTSQLARLEAAFVLMAQRIPATALRDALGQLVDALLPDALEQRAARGDGLAQLSLRPNADGSGWLLRAELDLETGELAHAVLTAARATDPDNAVDTAAGERLRAGGRQFGDPVPDHLQPGTWRAPRSRGRRMHDALKLALRTLLDSGALGVRDKVAPHIGVTVGLSALQREPGALPATGATGLSLPLTLVRRWWCDAYVTRYVLGLGHRVLETSHSTRTLKSHERRIKHVETGGQCQGAGCTRGPGSRLVPHHPDAWSRTGTTSLTDTVMLCDSDHAAVHRGLTLTLKDGRRLDEHGWLDGAGRAVVSRAAS